MDMQDIDIEQMQSKQTFFQRINTMIEWRDIQWAAADFSFLSIHIIFVPDVVSAYTFFFQFWYDVLNLWYNMCFFIFKA